MQARVKMEERAGRVERRFENESARRKYRGDLGAGITEGGDKAVLGLWEGSRRGRTLSGGGLSSGLKLDGESDGDYSSDSFAEGGDAHMDSSSLGGGMNGPLLQRFGKSARAAPSRTSAPCSPYKEGDGITTT